jgi:ABC-2 type transport system ATP-binding protein
MSAALSIPLRPERKAGAAMLKINDLSKTYPNGVQALKGVNLEIPRGMFGLLGPNGAGKSTLMRTLATLQEADTGTVFLDDLDVLKEKEQVRRVLGYLPQEYGLYPRISAVAMLDHFAVLKGYGKAGERRSVVESLLRMTNLWDARKQKLGTFSGGMKQRFGIAQALLGNPDLIIVDEPTAGLDPQERRRFLNLLGAIGESVVVILSTHIVEDVRELCARMAILDQGQVLASGSPDEAIAKLRGRVWETALDRENVAAHYPDWDVISERMVGGRVVVRVLEDQRPGEAFTAVEADLEDVYLAQIK